MKVARSHLVASVGWILATLFVTWVLAACGDQDRDDTPPLAARIFAEPPTLPPAPATPAATPGPAEPLPRTVAEVSLGMTQPEVEEVLGKLQCSDRPAGYTLCTTTGNTGEEVGDLEIYFYRDLVLSLAYLPRPPADSSAYLATLVGRYGEPSLNGLAQQDERGRLHEIYGWKDDATIYSVRFIWVEKAPEPRRLSSMVVTLWDRDAYFDWEEDPARQQSPLPEATPTARAATGPPTPELT